MEGTEEKEAINSMGGWRRERAGEGKTKGRMSLETCWRGGRLDNEESGAKLGQ